MSLFSLNNVRNGLAHPSHSVTLLKSLFPWKALSRDPECAHLIKSWRSGKLERRSIHDLFPQIDSVDVLLRLPYNRVIGTATDLGEVACIASVMKLISARRVLEIGTNDGFNALNLAANLIDDPGALICTLDLPTDDDTDASSVVRLATRAIPGSWERNSEISARRVRIRQFYGDSTRLDWKTLGGPFDLIFIDGCHERDFVARDTDNAMKHLARGGVIFWHDYGTIPDVSEVVDARAEADRIFAVLGTRLAIYRDPSRTHLS